MYIALIIVVQKGVAMKYNIYILCYYLFRIFPIKKNKIVISSYYGKGYGDNGKYICQELIKNRKKIDIVWLSEETRGFPDQIRVVKYKSLKSIYEQVTAKVWIDNCRKRSYVRKRKNQYYIMTWHGGIGPKKVEKEAERQLPRHYIKAAQRDSKMANLFVAESQWTYEMYKRAFWYDGEIDLCGVPREDILFRDESDLKAEIKKKMNINENIKILLYAPTFRQNMSKSIDVYKIEWKKILHALHERFGGEWLGMVRFHPNVNVKSEDLNLPMEVINVSKYSDMQELLLISDCVLSDYSSAIFEYGILKRPAFIYARDICEYLQERELALDYSNLPYPIAKTNTELCQVIKNFDKEKYMRDIYHFYYEFCGLVEGGNASKHIVDRVMKIIDI